LEASRRLANPERFCCRPEYIPWDIARPDFSQSLAIGGSPVERSGHHLYYRFFRIPKNVFTTQTSIMMLRMPNKRRANHRPASPFNTGQRLDFDRAGINDEIALKDETNEWAAFPVSRG
jgi:hypothetical protein